MSKYQRFAWAANHGSEQPCRMVVYDTESIQSPHPTMPGRINHRLRMGVAHYWRRHGQIWEKKDCVHFDSPESFWRFVYRHCKSREPIWVYSHNQSFDFTLVDGWAELSAGRLRVTDRGRPYTCHRTGEHRIGRPYQGVFAVDGLPFIITAKCDRGTVRVIDSLNYLPMSLSKIAKWVGMSKGRLPDKDATSDDWYVYCKNDVTILETAILRLLKLWSDKQLGTWQMTTASLAYSSFRHVTPRSGIVCHGDEPNELSDPMPMDAYGTGRQLDAREVSEVERRAYCGGRVIVNFVGDVISSTMPDTAHYHDLFTMERNVVSGPVSCYDVNGLYASVMVGNDYPIEILETVRQPAASVVRQLVAHFPCVADVIIDTYDSSYPLRTERRVLYPHGRYLTSLVGPELKRAVQLGHAIQVSNLCVYHAGSPFDGYVRYWHSIKEQAVRDNDDCWTAFSKSMLNSLFGKLGQRKPLWKTVSDITPRVPWGGFVADRGNGKGLTKFRSVARVVQEMTERRDCAHTATAVAACVTSYARVYMDGLRAMCPHRSVLYQDTDSMYVLPGGMETLVSSGKVHPTELGKLKHQGTYDTMSIYAPKVYRIDDRLVAAGLASGAVEKNGDVWEQTMFERLGSIIARGADGSVQAWKSLYAIPTRVTPFRIGSDGWTTPPTVSK